MGATSEAHRWAVKALELQGGHADALALMSQLYMERRWGWGGGGERREVYARGGEICSLGAVLVWICVGIVLSLFLLPPPLAAPLPSPPSSGV